jgi:hypothetical protein
MPLVQLHTRHANLALHTQTPKASCMLSKRPNGQPFNCFTFLLLGFANAAFPNG